MKKKVIIAFLCMSMLLSACGAKTDKAETQSDNTETVQVEDSDMEEQLKALAGDVVLCDYSSIPVDASLKEVTDEDIEVEIQNYLGSAATYEQITEGVVEEGDTVGISFVGRMDGEEFDGGSGDFDLTIGSGQFIPGFEDGLIGVNIGDTVTLELTFPEDYTEDLAGKDVEFEVTVNYKNGEEIIPELTDDFAKEVYGFEDLEDMKAYIKENLELINASNYDYEVNDLVYRYILDNSKVPAIPMPFTKQYAEDAKLVYLDYAKQYGYEGDDAIEQITGVTEEQFLADMEEMGTSYYQMDIIIQAVADDMGITVTDGDYDAYLEDQAAAYGYDSKETLKEELEANDMVDEFKKEILYNKVMLLLRENIV